MWQAEPGSFAVRTVAETREPVTTMGGLQIAPDITFADLRPSDSVLLVLPGADSWDRDPGANRQAVSAAREFLAARVPVAAICGATSGLAHAGPLDDRRTPAPPPSACSTAPGTPAVRCTATNRPSTTGD